MHAVTYSSAVLGPTDGAFRKGTRCAQPPHRAFTGKQPQCPFHHIDESDAFFFLSETNISV
jgi:hypothetical protein